MHSYLWAFVSLSALGFWLLIGIAAWKVLRPRRSANEKVRVKEKIVAVLRNGQGSNSIE